jgi:hypothetical protein
MSKKIRLRVIAVLTVFSILAAVFAALPASAQQTAPAVTPANTRSATIAAATAEVLQETSEIRGLPILRPVKSGAQSRTDIERMIIKNLDEETTPSEMHATELSLKKLGLVPNDFQYRAFIISLLSEQVAGYYDPKAQQFYLADWIELEGQLPVMAHELTHALQDQHFNLRRFDKWPKGDSDAELAVHALIEGDATLAMMQYILRKPERAREFMKSMSGTAASANEKIESAPRALRESLLFPYEQGAQFVTRLYARGGWKEVSQAFTVLPQSTEQILHADKYLAREAPVKVEMTDISKQLGRGWKRVDYDVSGEWSYYLILDEYLKSSSESEKAAAGWGGDRYAVYEGPKGEVMLAQLTVWDSEQDATEFFEAYVKRTGLRYAKEKLPETVSTDTGGFQILTNRFSTKWADSNLLRTTSGLVSIERNRSRVLILEGVPNMKTLAALQSDIWQQANRGKL